MTGLDAASQATLGRYGGVNNYHFAQRGIPFDGRVNDKNVNGKRWSVRSRDLTVAPRSEM